MARLRVDKPKNEADEIALGDAFEQFVASSPEAQAMRQRYLDGDYAPVLSGSAGKALKTPSHVLVNRDLEQLAAENGIQLPHDWVYNPQTGQAEKLSWFNRNASWLMPLAIVGGGAAAGAAMGGGSAASSVAAPAGAGGGAATTGATAAGASTATTVAQNTAKDAAKEAAKKTAQNSFDGMDLSEIMKLALLQGGLGIAGGLLDKDQERKSFQGTSADPVKMLTGAQDAIRDFQEPLMTRLRTPVTIPGASAPSTRFSGGPLPFDVGVSGSVPERQTSSMEPRARAEQLLGMLNTGRR